MIIIMSLIAVISTITIFFVIRKMLKNLDIFVSFLFCIFCIFYVLLRNFLFFFIFYRYSSDILFFFLSFFVLICLFCISSAVIFYQFKKKESVESLLISISLIIFTPVAMKISSELYPYQTFYRWALFHPTQFIEAKKKKESLQEINAWDFADMNSSPMLISSQHYNLTILKDLELWKIKNNIICNIDSVYKVYSKMYIVFPYTNTECYKKTDIYKNNNK